MRLLFAGSPEISATSLRMIAPHFEVTCVLTNTDKPAGRGRGVKPSAVAVEAESFGIPLIKADRADEEIARIARGYGPTLLVVVAFGHIFTPAFLDIFPMGGVNLHPSLLPKYRGPSPITAAILNGDRETGITVQKLAHKMDTGDILSQTVIPLRGDETTGTLTEHCAESGAALLLDTLRRIADGTAATVPQDESQATYCGLIKKTDGIINWNTPAEKIEKLVRAFTPWPKAATVFKEKRLFILRSAITPKSVANGHNPPARPGEVTGIDKTGGILIQTAEGLLLVKDLQLEAKIPMDWRSFLNGHPDFFGSVLGVPT